jgi:predicted transcriptional regulator
MIIPCEMAVKSIVPSIRAMVAKELNESYNMKQDDIACILGITQSAVSQYLNNVRGNSLDLKDVKEVQIAVKDLVFMLKETPKSTRAICQKYCEICEIIRTRRMLCQIHHRLDPLIDTANCDTCMPF